MPEPAENLKSAFPNAAARWKLRTQSLEFGALPKLMGIVNVTPDSFSDGGNFSDPDAAVEQALRLIDEGADLIDIGGESTRPYADPVDLESELARVLPVITKLAKQSDVPISIDTTKSSIAKAAIDAGAEIINDISGLEADPDMVDIAVQTGAGVCAMHMLGTPQTMQDDPRYEDVVADVLEYLEGRRLKLEQAGIERSKICLDPGIGFGKTHRHNLELLAHIDRFHRLGQPILVGHSRKGFIGKVIGDKEADRVYGTLAITIRLAQQGVQIIRLHEIAPAQQALAMLHAIDGLH